MKRISFVFVAAVACAAVGCKKADYDCAKAIDKSMEVSKADLEQMPGMDAKTMGKMKEMGLQHCKDDKWSEDVLKCMAEAKTEADAQACYGKLSPAQQEKMNKAAMEMAKPSGPGAGEAGSAGGATGSDTGSAGSAATPK
jgi:hypothetical protein